MTEDDRLKLEHRLDQIEESADQDHEALGKLQKDFAVLKSEFEQFREETQKTMRLLMWLTDSVRCLGLNSDPQAKSGLDKRFHDQFEELKNRFRR